MFAVERLQRIRRTLLERRRVEVSTLSELLNVSEVTIRRDLEKLEQEGFLKKTYGGAVLVSELERPELGDAVQEEERLVGLTAADLIEEGDSVFIGSGPICRQIARYCRQKRGLTVVSNDPRVGLELFESPGIRIILTGGDLRPDSASLLGPLAVQSLQNMLVGKAFIAVGGVDLRHGYTVSTMEELQIIQTVLDRCKERIVVADRARFGRVSFTPLGPLDLAEKVVTNQGVPDEYKRFYFERGIRLFTSFSLTQ